MRSTRSKQTPKLADSFKVIVATTQISGTDPQPTRQWQFEAIGTSWWVGIYDAIDENVWTQLQSVITARVKAFDHNYSRFRTDSLVARFAQTAGSYAMPTDFEPLYSWYRQLYDATDGLVTPCIGQTLSDTGYDAQYSFKSKSLHRPPAWDDVIDFSDSKLTIRQPLILDFGAAGKGYLVDQISDLIRQNGCRQYCVDAGGDLYVHGLELRVGLENPLDSTQVIGVTTVCDRALCGSAGNRRRWGNYHHVIDPQRLTSPQHILAIWVAADTAMQADGLTTALYFKSPQELLALFQFEYLVVYADGMVARSSGFMADMFGEHA